MNKIKVLYISQKIDPYIEDGQMSQISRYLPQWIQEQGKEIRTFMPRFGCINERRFQLHEVIRLSGMNLIINDTDHPLIIKVASIQAARMQVYFIDNEEYFQRKTIFADERARFHKDNDERMIFFCRGVIETVKKLGWAPDIVHCHGWMTSLIPYYLKKVFNDNPVFANSRVITSIYNEDFSDTINKNMLKKMEVQDDSSPIFDHLKNVSFDNLNKFAIDMSDAVIAGTEVISPVLKKYLKSTDKPQLEYQGGENYANAYSDFYDELLLCEPVLVG